MAALSCNKQSLDAAICLVENVVRGLKEKVEVKEASLRSQKLVQDVAVQTRRDEPCQPGLVPCESGVLLPLEAHGRRRKVTPSTRLSQKSSRNPCRSMRVVASKVKSPSEHSWKYATHKRAKSKWKYDHPTLNHKFRLALSQSGPQGPRTCSFNPPFLPATSQGTSHHFAAQVQEQIALSKHNHYSEEAAPQVSGRKCKNRQPGLQMRSLSLKSAIDNIQEELNLLSRKLDCIS